jgi:hypothetical protein
MVWWKRDGSPPPRRADRNRRLAFDVVEGRVLLSTVPGHRAAALQKARQLATVTSPVQEGTDAGSTPATDHVTVGKQVEFAVKTYADGRSMAASPAVQKVGLSFAKVAVSHDARKVGLAYVRAAIRGNGKTINQLSHTKLVQKVADQFTQVGKSRFVKRVGDAFAGFGRSVADQFSRLFLHKSSTTTNKTAK